jgi:hypothetical protein
MGSKEKRIQKTECGVEKSEKFWNRRLADVILKIKNKSRGKIMERYKNLNGDPSSLKLRRDGQEQGRNRGVL